MISDEERCEVAERLRVYSHDFDFSDSDPFWYVSKAVFGDVDAHTYCSVFDRLADLIDRPAARNVAPAPSGHEPRAFTCELCGEWQPMDCGFAHCPNCGAEVVSDGDD